MLKKGTFTISIDTELAWGKRSIGGLPIVLKNADKIPGLVRDMLTIFDRYGLHATWAVVGHLMLENAAAKSKYPAGTFKCAGSVECDDPAQQRFWYGHGLLKDILACPTSQEVGCHSFYHTNAGSAGLTTGQYADELKLCQEVALREFGIHLDSFVFPRNRVAHLDALQEAGFRYYRSHHDRSWYSGLPQSIKGYGRNMDALLALPPSVWPPVESNGLISSSGSMFLAINPRFGYSHRLRAKKILRGLDRAARTGKDFHLWFHEFDPLIDREGYLAVLEEVGAHYQDLKRRNLLESRCMRDTSCL